jgi:hypothetical protein
MNDSAREIDANDVARRLSDGLKIASRRAEQTTPFVITSLPSRDATSGRTDGRIYIN